MLYRPGKSALQKIIQKIGKNRQIRIFKKNGEKRTLEVEEEEGTNGGLLERTGREINSRKKIGEEGEIEVAKSVMSRGRSYLAVMLGGGPDRA
ncbi:hypothetical protein M0R45_024439 [Rubus argutus]|uniref:Uncharacterized protein n=1 Tax=Rubus argutus TaxID=59490 RepID=A0AAW1WT72_RUBAR